MKKIDGKPIGNAAMPIRLKITEADIKAGAPLNPDACAVALAACRKVKGVTAAKAHLGCIYLLLNKRWQRFMTSGPLRTEIVAFDRGGRFWPGEYDLLPVPTAALIRRIRGETLASPQRKRAKRRKPHHIEGVRGTAHRNEPPTE